MFELLVLLFVISFCCFCLRLVLLLPFWNGLVAVSMRIFGSMQIVYPGHGAWQFSVWAFAAGQN